jgi:hypothetical protein
MIRGICTPRGPQADSRPGVDYLLSVFLASASVALILCGFPALYLLESNAAYFGDGASSARLVWMIGGAILIITALIGYRQRRHRLAATCFWGLLCLSLLWPSFQTLRSRYDEAWLVSMVMALALAAGIVAARSQKFRTQALPVASLLGALLLVWWTAAVVRHAVAATDDRHGHVAAKQGPAARTARWQRIGSPSFPDIYHIVVDEFQTDFFTSLLTEARRRQLAGFRFYPRTTTPFGRTELALAALFSGAPYDYSGEPREYISEAFSGRRSLLTQLKELGYWSVGYLQRIYPQGARSPFDETYFHGEFTDLSHDSGVDRLFLSLWLYSTLPRALGRSLVREPTWEQLEARTLLPDEAPVRSLHSFRQLIAVEGSRRPPPDVPRYVFTHLVLPHVPLVLRADCTVQPGRQTTVLAQSECTLRTLLHFVDALVQQRRFRDALILIHADHGARHVVRDGELADARGGSYSPEWSWGRARPLMLIKPAGVAAEAPFMIDERPADLYDVYPTILDSAGAGIGLRLTGCSLLRPPCASRTRYYHFYDKADERTIIDGTLKRYRIEGDAITFDREIPLHR